MVEIEDLQYEWIDQNTGPHIKYVLEIDEYRAAVGVYVIGGPVEKYQIGSDLFLVERGVLKELMRGHILCDTKAAGQWYLTEEMGHLERVIDREKITRRALLYGG